MTSRLFNPGELSPPVGFSHAMQGYGHPVTLAGQIGCDGDGKIVAPGDLVAQFARALENILVALRAAQGSPSDVAFLRIYTTDVAGYRTHVKELGAAYRERMGKHFPPMALLGVTELFDPEAMIEIEGLAYVDSD
ncbi:MAG: RidA family protein [Planctomycetota bacterium]